MVMIYATKQAYVLSVRKGPDIRKLKCPKLLGECLAAIALGWFLGWHGAGLISGWFVG